MDNGKKIHLLIKFFSKKEHAEEFMDGNLYLNRLSFFMRIESPENDGRNDQMEALSQWVQPHDCKMTLKIPGLPDLNITGENLVSPFLLRRTGYKNLHLFCMYAMGIDESKFIDGKTDYSVRESEILKEQLWIDERCFDFGGYAVIVPVTQFMERLQIELSNLSFHHTYGQVSYFDESVFSGSFSEETIPFNKRDKYSYQNEFRVCIYTGTDDDEPRTISIGNIKDISALVKSSDLNTVFSDASLKI